MNFSFGAEIFDTKKGKKKRNVNNRNNSNSNLVLHDNKNKNKFVVRIVREKNVNLGEIDDSYKEVFKSIFKERVNKVLRYSDNVIRRNIFHGCEDDKIIGKVYTVYIDIEKAEKSRRRYIINEILEKKRNEIMEMIYNLKRKMILIKRYELMGFIFNKRKRKEICKYIFDYDTLGIIPFISENYDKIETEEDLMIFCYNVLLRDFSIENKIIIGKKKNKDEKEKEIIKKEKKWNSVSKINSEQNKYDQLNKGEKKLIKKIRNITPCHLKNNSQLLSLIKEKNKDFFEELLKREIDNCIDMSMEIDSNVSPEIFKTTSRKYTDIRNSRNKNIFTSTSMFQNKDNVDNFLDFRKNDLNHFKKMNMTLDYVLNSDVRNFKTFYRNLKKYYLMDLILIKCKHNIKKSCNDIKYYENIFSLWMKKHKIIINSFGLLCNEIPYDLKLIDI